MIKKKERFFKDKKSKLPHHLRLRIPDSQKTDQWYMDIADYLVPTHSTTIEGYQELKNAYEFMNNDFSGFKDAIQRFCNPVGEDVMEDIYREFQPFNRLPSKVGVLKGELLKRSDKHEINMMSQKPMKRETELYKEALQQSLEEEVLLAIKRAGLLNQNMRPEAIEAEINRLKTQKAPDDLSVKEFKSEYEIFYTKGLKLASQWNDTKRLSMETLEDCLVGDRMFLYIGWDHGKPVINALNPLFVGFHKNPNEPYIHKGDWAYYRTPITIADLLTEAGDTLSETEIDELLVNSYTVNSKVDKRHSVIGGRGESEYVRSYPASDFLYNASQDGRGDYASKNTGIHQGQGLERYYNQERLLWKTHLEFKAFTPLVFLTTIDLNGEEDTIYLRKDSDIIPKDAEKYQAVNRYGEKSTFYQWEENGIQNKATVIYIPRRYEVTRYGDNIYTNMREVPFQPLSVENPFTSFELSYKGGILTSRNAKSISLVMRAIPTALQLCYVKLIQNRELSKYQGFIQDVDTDQIPTALGEDVDGNKVRDPFLTWFAYRKRTGVNFYSGSQNTLGTLVPNTRSPGSSGYYLGTSAELLNLQQFSELLDREVGITMGISPQREAQFSGNTNVTDNKQAIAQSHHITEPYFFLHSEIWRHAYNEWLYAFKTYCERIFLEYPDKKEHIFNYILPDGTKELLKVTPKMLEHVDIGLFVSNSGQAQQYLDIMLQLSHSFAQNAAEGIKEMSALIKGITSGMSPEEVHKMLSIASDRQQQRQQQQQEAMEKAENLRQERELQNREDLQEHEMDKIKLKGVEDRLTKKLEKTLEALAWNEDKDVDNDGQLDVLEFAQNGENARIAAKQKDRELDIKEKELLSKERIAAATLKSNEKIAKQNSKSKDK